MSNLPMHCGTSREAKLIGRGRSGVVYRDHDDRGRPVARKIFSGDGPSRLVNYLLTGAPNPYGWNEHAVRAAVCRRQILANLVRYWFDGRLRVPETYAVAWNPDHRAYELGAEFVYGCHVPLRHSRGDGGDDPLRELVRSVMKPLQRRLVEAGCDGLVWQAGLGNPVAASNFLLERTSGFSLTPVDEKVRLKPDVRPYGPTVAQRWVWIDLESGVPALFPMNPAALLRFYLPRSFRFRRCLFDDVDVTRLRGYLNNHRALISQKLGSDTFAALQKQVDELERHQSAWKSLNRTQRSIAYFQCKGRIAQAEADWYARRPLRWHARLAGMSVVYGLDRLAAGARQLCHCLTQTDWGRLARTAWRFVTSERFRRRMSRRYVLQRIGAWQQRRFLNEPAAARLRAELRHDEAASYVADFGVHVALKPVVKILQWTVLPSLYVLGIADMPVLAAIVAGGGAIARTAYTAARLIQATLRGQRRPWVALGVGLLPIVGAAAYPAQLGYSSADDRRQLPQFVLYDTFAGLGRAVPIWGGSDSLVEGWFNRLPDLVTRWLRSAYERLVQRRVSRAPKGIR